MDLALGKRTYIHGSRPTVARSGQAGRVPHTRIGPKTGLVPVERTKLVRPCDAFEFGNDWHSKIELGVVDHVNR